MLAGSSGAARSTSSRHWLEIGARAAQRGPPGHRVAARSRPSTSRSGICVRALLDVPLVDAAAGVRTTACRSTAAAASARTRDERLARAARRLGRREGIPRVKMKLGREPDARPAAARRRARGDRRRRELYVDANGAFGAKEAMRWARALRRGVGRRAGSRSRSRRRTSTGCGSSASAPPLDVAAGEYAYVLGRLPQPDRLASTACRPTSRAAAASPALLRVNGLAAAHGLDLSGHCAPQLSAHALCGVDRLRHLEYFHDHVRIESMLFDGVLEPVDGALVPDRSRPGHGLELKRAEARAVGGMIGRCSRTSARAACRSCSRATTALSAPALGARDLLRALQGLVRRQVDVDAARPDAAADRRRRRRRRLRAGGAHRPARRLGALLPRRPRRDRHAHPGRPQAPGRLQGGALQPRHGPAAPRARARSASSARSASPPRSSSASDECRGQAHPIPHGLPKQERGTTPQMVGRYPDYDVLAQASPLGRGDARRRPRPRRERAADRFFDEAEARTLKAFCDIVTAQDDEPRIPVLSYIDEKLHGGQAATAGSTSTCPTTASSGGASRAGLDERGAARLRSTRSPPRRSRTQVGIVHRFSKGELHGGVWDDAQRLARVLGRHALRRAGVLLAPVGVERDRLRRAGLPARLRRVRLARTSASASAGRREEAVHYDPVTRHAEAGPRLTRRQGLLAMPRDNDSAFLLDKHKRGLQNLDRMARYRDERRRSTSSSSAPAPAAACSRSGSRARAGGSSCSRRGRSGTPTATG